MTDIIERLRFKTELKTPEDVHVLFADAAAEIELLRKENEELHIIIDNLRGIFFNGAYVAESRVAKLKIARTALAEEK